MRTRVRPLVIMVLVACLASLAVLEATVTIAFRNEDSIVFAADSRVTWTRHLEDRDEILSSTTSICKLRHSGRWWFMVSGHHSAGAEERDVFVLVAEAIASSKTLPDAMNAISENASAGIYDSLKSAFQARFERDLPMLLIAVGGLDGRKLAVGVYEYTLKQRQPFSLSGRWAACPGDLCPDGRLSYIASISAEPAFRLMQMRPRPPWLLRGDAMAARRLIELQAAATPKHVGPPIDVLQLGQDGRAQWIGRDKASLCQPL